MSQYRALDPHKIAQTLDQLGRRIDERFPASGLCRLCGELKETAESASSRAAALARPDLGIRAAVAALVLLGLGLVVLLARSLLLQPVGERGDSLYSVLQGIDSAFNIIVLAGAAVLFLARLEQIGKRNRALADLHELRALIHVVDMHQLTKDPGMAMAPGAGTASSPKRTLTPFELTRYLDYCSEMLSLAAKIAALYAQSSRDGAVIGTVNDIEQLSTNLSEKIWQKIAILQRELEVAAPAPRPAAPPAPAAQEPPPSPPPS